ncbi:protein pygopus-like [Paramacrobiotus metropolitanus]|uniref:protein pygopus-like n=1 Tax=Paramacrobiotus metropolitanus TaxID=2943436 RepID=UPI002445C086|nr:protein pygopus-like [Paramacrobiotus metropolitanus]
MDPGFERHSNLMMMHGQMPQPGMAPMGMMHMAPHPHGPQGMSMPDMMPGMTAGMQDRKVLHEAPSGPPPPKKKKKSSAKSQQNAAIPPPHAMSVGMSMPGQMDSGLAMARDTGPIMVQNPFDDFPEQRHSVPMQHPGNFRMGGMPPGHPGMPPPHGQQRMQFASPPQPMPPYSQPPHMHPHGPNINVQQLQHQMEMRSIGQQGPPRMGHPDAAGNTIYPEDKFMVFNSQNPNAPPIYPCGRCHKEVHENDQTVFCESGCNFWFHRACTGLTEAANKYLAMEHYAEWICENCVHRNPGPFVKLKP